MASLGLKFGRGDGVRYIGINDDLDLEQAKKLHSVLARTDHVRVSFIEKRGSGTEIQIDTIAEIRPDDFVRHAGEVVVQALSEMGHEVSVIDPSVQRMAIDEPIFA